VVARSVRSERHEALPQQHCTFIAFWFEVLAILASVCFHDGSNASPEEVRMKIRLTNRQMPMLCTAATAADSRSLLG
jgi:hypothetical protein